MNPLYRQIGMNSSPAPFNNMVTAFNQFKQTLTGDPKQQVQNLLNSGAMTQAQYNQLSNMARQLMSVLK